MTEVARPIRSSFDLGWGGISELTSRANSDFSKHQRHSLQLDPQVSLQLSCPLVPEPCGADQLLSSSDTAQLLLLLQQQQQLADDGSRSAEEEGIDAQIRRLVQLKQFLRTSKPTVTQHQQTILEDVGLVSPMQSESVLHGSQGQDLQSWGNPLAAPGTASARASLDMSALAQQLTALEMSNQAAVAALAADAQNLAELSAALHSANNAGGNRLSVDISGPGLADMNDMMAAAAIAASRRTSLCIPTPQMSGLLDNMLLDSMASAALGAHQVQQSHMQAPDQVLQSAGAALAMQSALYAPAAPVLDQQLQSPMTTAGMTSMGFTAGAQLPGRHSLDCSLLNPSAMSPAATMGHMAGLTSPSPRPGGAPHASGLPSPACRRASFNLPQAPLLGDRGLLLAQAQAQSAQAAQSDAAGWGFSSRRSGAVRHSMDVRRASSDLTRVQTPDQRQPPRKSVSLITPATSSSSGSSSGRSSPPCVRPASQGGPRRTSLDRPPVQPPKWSPAAATSGAGGAASVAISSPQQQQAAAEAGTSSSGGAARKGTGVFIPSCMIKP